MTDSPHTPSHSRPEWLVLAGQDRFGEQRGLGIGTIAFKVTTEDGRLFIVENTFEKGAVPRGIFTTTRTSGSMLSKASSSSRSGRKELD